MDSEHVAARDGKRERSVAGTQPVCLLDSALVLLNEGPGDDPNVVLGRFP